MYSIHNILIYDSFVQFEVVLAAYFMKTAGEVNTLGLSAAPALSCEGVRSTAQPGAAEPGGENEEPLAVVRDGHILTALPNGYVDFAL